MNGTKGVNKKVVILTGNEWRHQFFRKKVALHSGIQVVRTYCESERNLLQHVEEDEASDLRSQHLLARLQSEKDFFELFVNTAPDNSHPVEIVRGEINDPRYFEEILYLQPDLIIVYGASIIKEPLLSAFNGRILNVHLGLSPYYRGSATNFWPLVHGLPECVGATFMFIDAGIDTGEIIHQLRPSIQYFDTPSAIGNRLISQMTDTYCNIIVQLDHLQKVSVDQPGNTRRFCKKKDYNEASVATLYQNFNNGMMHNYLENKTTRDKAFPLVVQPILTYDKSSHVPLCKEVQ